MKLTVQSRSVTGKKVKLLRKEGIVPWVIYGKHLDEAFSFCVWRINFLKVFSKTWRNTPIEISADQGEYLVLVQDLQLDPVSDHLIHIDLLAVNKDEKVTAEVPVVLTGVSPYEKSGLWRVQLILSNIEVEALPLDLPHDITIDVSVLEEEWQVIHLSDINLWDKVEFVDELSRTILTTVAFAKEEEEVVAEWDDAEVAADWKATEWDAE
jgi:large subunit ribosomal protein L25